MGILEKDPEMFNLQEKRKDALTRRTIMAFRSRAPIPPSSPTMEQAAAAMTSSVTSRRTPSLGCRGHWELAQIKSPVHCIVHEIRMGFSFSVAGI